MKPSNKIRRAILKLAAQDPDLDFGLPLDTDEQVEEAYDKLIEAEAHWDLESEFREGEVETGMPTEYSRHYESKSVARKMDDGTWIGWIYWYGGGKHGEPGGIEWIEYAYELTCKEEEKVVVVREFAKVG